MYITLHLLLSIYLYVNLLIHRHKMHQTVG